MLTVETDGTEEAKTKIITVYPSQWWKETVPNNIPYFRDLPRKRSSSLENFAFEFFSKERRKRKGKREKKEKKPPLKTRRRSFRGTGRRGTRVDGGRIIAQLHSPPPFPPFGSKTRSPPLPAPVAGEIRKVAWYIKPKGTS